MLPNFPKRKQPHPFACLPTCVQASLDFLNGEASTPVSYAKALSYCAEFQGGGCDWALTAEEITRAKEFDADVLCDGTEDRDEALLKLHEKIYDEVPVIVRLQLSNDETINHAVVVIGFRGDDSLNGVGSEVIVMNPDAGPTGDYVPYDLEDFLAKWEIVDFTGIWINQ